MATIDNYGTQPFAVFYIYKRSVPNLSLINLLGNKSLLSQEPHILIFKNIF